MSHQRTRTRARSEEERTTAARRHRRADRERRLGFARARGDLHHRGCLRRHHLVAGPDSEVISRSSSPSDAIPQHAVLVLVLRAVGGLNLVPFWLGWIQGRTPLRFCCPIELVWCVVPSRRSVCDVKSLGELGSFEWGRAGSLGEIRILAHL